MDNYDTIGDRAKDFLSTGHRFVTLGNLKNDLSKIKVVRNAIAHKSDRAWEQFLEVVTDAPFSLAAKQRKGITPGRFFSAHKWHGNPFLTSSVVQIEKCVLELVP